MPVYQNSGGGLGQALAGGVDAFMGARRQKRQDELFEQQMADHLDAQNRQRITDESNGLHILKPGELPPSQVSRGLIDYAGAAGNRATPNNVVNSAIDFSGFVDPQPRAQIPGGTTPPIMPTLSRAGAGAANTPGAPQTFRDMIASMSGGGVDRGPQYQTGNGYYIDKAPQWQKEDATSGKMQAEKMFEAQLAASMADQGVNRDVRKAQMLAPLDIQKAVGIAQGTAPIDVAKAVGIEQGVGPLRAANAVAQARALAPLDIQKAIETAQGLAPIDVKKAVDISHGTLGDRQAIAAAAATNKPATEPERMAAGFGARMVSASKTLNALESDPEMLKTLTGQMGSPNGSGKLSVIGNYTLGKNAQLYQQAQSNWVRANLRKESGAAIGDAEMASEIKNYFPQPGDKPEVVKQKQDNRAIAEQNMKKNAGTAWDASMDALLSPKTGTDPGGDIDLGLDPSANPFASLIPKKP